MWFPGMKMSMYSLGHLAVLGCAIIMCYQRKANLSTESQHRSAAELARNTTGKEAIRSKICFCCHTRQIENKRTQ